MVAHWLKAEHLAESWFGVWLWFAFLLWGLSVVHVDILQESQLLPVHKVALGSQAHSPARGCLRTSWQGERTRSWAWSSLPCSWVSSHLLTAYEARPCDYGLIMSGRARPSRRSCCAARPQHHCSLCIVVSSLVAMRVVG